MGKGPIKGLESLEEEKDQSSCSSMYDDTGRRWPSTATKRALTRNPICTLILDVPTSVTVRMNLLFKLCSTWYFVLAAQTKTVTYQMEETLGVMAQKKK